VYYQAVQGTATTQLRRFVEAATTTYPDITTVKEEWESLLTYLTDEDAIIVIDEFPYLIESNEGLPSVIQYLWDIAVDESQATVVLTAEQGGSPPL
jgi:AAA+ ATPase superfamily predicted ATPase